MNHVQLVERLRLEASLPIPPITTMVGATDEVKRLGARITDAWVDMQVADVDWKFMRRQATPTVTLLGGGRWTPAALGITGGIHRWRVDQAPTMDGDGYMVRCWDPTNVAGGEWRVRELDEGAFTARFGVGPQTPGQPQYRATASNGDLLIGPAPDRNYTLRIDYERAIQFLAADADAPDMPEAFHLAIMWRALYQFGVDDATPEDITRAQKQYNTLESALLRHQSQRIVIRFGGLR
jgi:hypothetical protein